MRELSTHAKVAKLCRAFLKEKGIKGSCVSSSYSGGTSVDVYVKDVSPDVEKMLNEEFAQYEYGHFDGMTDCYNYDNWDASIPQVQYLFVHVEFSDEMKDSAAQYLKDVYGVADNVESYKKFDNDYRVAIYRVLRGDLGEFWEMKGKSYGKVG